MRETNIYSNYLKKINTRRETHKLLITVDNQERMRMRQHKQGIEKARFKRQREKKLEITRGKGMYGYRLVAE